MCRKLLSAVEAISEHGEYDNKLTNFSSLELMFSILIVVLSF